MTDALSFEEDWEEDLILKPSFASALEEELEKLDGLIATRSGDAQDVTAWFVSARSRMIALMREEEAWRRR